MDIFSLLFLYFLSQKSDFAASLKPILGNVKSSEDILKFLADLNRFSEAFSSFGKNKNGKEDEKKAEKPPETKAEQAPQKETPRSPTAGIASDYIQKSLDAYFKKR